MCRFRGPGSITSRTYSKTYCRCFNAAVMPTTAILGKDARTHRSALQVWTHIVFAKNGQLKQVHFALGCSRARAMLHLTMSRSGYSG